MAKKKKEAEKPSAVELVSEATFEFWKFCKLLFGNVSETPYRMNDLKPTNQFYERAVKMAEELEIDWEKMSDAESNRVMLNMLGDLYEEIGNASDRKCTISIDVVLADKSSHKVITEETGGADADA